MPSEKQTKGKVRTLANTNLKEYMAELAKYDFAEEFAEYEGGYICDIISEIADDGISIYTQDQMDFAMQHDDLAQEAIDEGLAPDPIAGDGFRSYIASVGVAAWYMDNERTMYDNLKECVLYSALYNLRKQYGIEKMTEGQEMEIEALEFDNNDCLEDVIEEVAKVLGLIEDEDEE